MSNKEFIPYNISEDGHYGMRKTGFPEGLPQEAVVYFPNGYQPEPIEAEPQPQTEHNMSTLDK